MYKDKKVLAIITARGGSKRLPHKNILDLNGKPLIAWTIEAAKQSKYIDTLMVSTDDIKIKDISIKCGAEVPFIRPKKLATDKAKSVDVIFHAIEYYKRHGFKFDYIILLQPTSPLRTTDDIDNAFRLLSNRIKAVVSVCTTEHPPLWANTLPKNLLMKDFLSPEIKNKRSQDLPKYYRLNGAIYISDIDYMIQNDGFIGDNTKAFIMPIQRSIDVDNKTDFVMCELLMKENEI